MSAKRRPVTSDYLPATRRGGRRPGAGAPKGNLNGLKTGAHSPRVKAVLRAIAENPESRAVFLALAQKGALQRRQTREMVIALARLMHDRPIAEEARRRLNEIADAHEQALRQEEVRQSVRNYERTHHETIRTDRLDAEIDRLAITKLKAQLAAIQAQARQRRLAARLRRANVSLARLILNPPAGDFTKEVSE